MKHSAIAVFFFLLASCTSKTPVDYSTYWTQLQSSITYAPDNIKEASRTDNEYDSSGRLIKISKYSNESLVSKSHEYAYSDHLLTYTQELYVSGQSPITTKYKIKYMDPYWSRPDTIIAYMADGLTETGRTEYTYDSQYRKIGVVNKLKSVVVSKSLNYSYSAKSVEYTTVNFGLNGDTISKIENTYDSDGKLIINFTYVNGVPVTKSHDYTYNGKEVTFLTDNYTNGVVTSTVKSKYIYFK